MGAIVVDASALVTYLLRIEPDVAFASAIEDADVEPHVPELCDIELVSALRRGLLGGQIEPDRAAEAIDDYLALPLTKHGHGFLLSRVIELRNNFTAYDAAYVALAERLGASLLTSDSHLAAAARRHTAVHVLPEQA